VYLNQAPAFFCASAHLCYTHPGFKPREEVEVVRKDWNPPPSENIEDRRDEPPYVPDWTQRYLPRTPREILENQHRESLSENIRRDYKVFGA